MLGIHKLCHMSNILKSLKIFNFEDLYIFTKLSFLNSIKQNEISTHIFLSLCNLTRNNRSKSFIQDILVLEKRFNSNIRDIYLECKSHKLLLKKSLDSRDGIADSINTCLKNFKSNTYKSILNNLIKPKFIKEDEEFQELLQYLIIYAFFV